MGGVMGINILVPSRSRLKWRRWVGEDPSIDLI